MRSKSFLLLCLSVLLLSISGLSQGQEEEDYTPSPDFDAELANAEPTRIDFYNKRFGVAGRAGFIVGAVPGAGIDAFYTPNKSWQLGLQFQNGSISLEETEDFVESYAKLDATNVLFAARYFIWNSLNVTLMGGLRRLEWDIKASSMLTNSSIQVTGNVNSTVLGISIGNTWRFDSGFFIGGDWIGYLIPVNSDDNTKTTTTGSADETLIESSKDNEKLANTFSKMPTPQALMFNIGWIF